MPRLKIRHESVYAYPEPVRFGRWRLLTRPLDTHATRLIEASLETPPARIEWSYDAYGNCVCHLTPLAEATELRVVNTLVVERYPAPLVSVRADGQPASALVLYSKPDRAILEPFIAPATDDKGGAYAAWLQRLMGSPTEPALDLLTRMNDAIHNQFDYCARDAPGTQSPAETLASNSGTCRDFAWLLIESARRLGFAARFATGYLHSPGMTVRGAGATHAWCEVFLPDLGWMEFDPTNGLVESSCLIRVATTRTWLEADPMNGSALSVADGAPSPVTLTVAVDVDLVDEAGAASETQIIQRVA